MLWLAVVAVFPSCIYFKRGVSQLFWFARELNYKWETNFGISSMPFIRSSSSTRVCYAVQCFRMTSPYFMQSRPVITRSGSQHANCGPAASLKSKLTNSRSKAGPASSAAVKVEEEEAKISEQRPSSAPLPTGKVYVGLLTHSLDN